MNATAIISLVGNVLLFVLLIRSGRKAAAAHQRFSDFFQVWWRTRGMARPVSDYNAPEGMVWVCLACGKTSVNRMDGKGGWDESCFLNSALYRNEQLVFAPGSSRVTSVTGDPVSCS